jgi:pimeloyl-ACP methyl ester carboxylesterase
MILEQSADLGAIRLNYACGPKNGPPLALFHGVTRRWQSFLPVWSALSTRWQLLAWDARGHGLSGRDPSEQAANGSESGYQVVDYVADAVQFVSQTFTQPGVLYGHSLGAMVALATAAAVPEHVSAIILEDPPFNTMGTRIDQTSLLSFFSGLMPFAGHRTDIGEIARELAEVPITIPGQVKTIRLGETRDATALRFTARSLSDLDPRVLQSIVSGNWMAGYQFETILSQVQCPVLLLQADPQCGAMLTEADVAVAVKSLRDATLIRFANAPHLIHWSQPEMLLRHVLGFLEALQH